MQVCLLLVLAFAISCQAAFLNSDAETQEGDPAAVQGSLDEDAEKQRLIFLQVKKTVTTTSTSTVTSSTFDLCMTAYSTASSCYASGRKKRAIDIERIQEPVIKEEPVEPVSQVSSAPVEESDDKGKFLVQTTATTTTMTTTTTSYTTTATLKVTATSCNTYLVVPLSVCG